MARATDARIHCELTALLGLADQARGFSLLPRYASGSLLSGRHSSRLRGRGLNFEELRNYRDGDDIRALDWKVTLRTGRPHVRAYSEEKDRPVLLLVDQRRSMFFASLEVMKSVVAARLAALLGWRALHDNDRVGALIFTDRQRFWHEPRRQREHWMRALGDLCRANQSLGVGAAVDGGEAALNQALRQVARMQGKDAVLVVLSDWHGWNGETFELLKRLRMHNDVLGCFICDPLESALVDASGLVVSDGQLQLQVDASRGELDRRFRQAAQAKQDELARQLRLGGLPLLLMDTAGDELRQLKAALAGHR